MILRVDYGIYFNSRVNLFTLDGLPCLHSLDKITQHYQAIQGFLKVHFILFFRSFLSARWKSFGFGLNRVVKF